MSGRARPGRCHLAGRDVQHARAVQRCRVPESDRRRIVAVLPIEVEKQQHPLRGKVMSSGTAVSEAQSIAATNDNGPWFSHTGRATESGSPGCPPKTAATRAPGPAVLVAWRDEHAQGIGPHGLRRGAYRLRPVRPRRLGPPLHAAVINVAGCQVLGIAWDEGDHSMRLRGERPGGQVYPVTLDHDRAGGTLLHWTIRSRSARPPLPSARSNSRERNARFRITRQLLQAPASHLTLRARRSLQRGAHRRRSVCRPR